MIKIINYSCTSKNGEVEVTEPETGQYFEEVTRNDLITAIECRLQSMPSREETLGYHSQIEATIFLVKLVYDLDRLEQYIEILGRHWERKFTLNFTSGKYCSEYSISFEGDLKSALLDYNYKSFSQLMKAPAITIQELREKHLPLHFFSLENGRDFSRNTVYYKGSSKQFCLPIWDLVREAEEKELLIKGSSSFKAKYNDDSCRIEIEIISLDSAVGNNKREYTYKGFIDLDSFEIILEDTNVYRFGS